eukprot:446662_1
MHMARTTSLQSTLLLCIIFIQRFFIIASDCNGNCNHHDDLQNTWCCIKHIATATLSDIPNYVNGVSDVIQIKWFLNGACALFAALFVSLMDFLKYRDKFNPIKRPNLSWNCNADVVVQRMSPILLSRAPIDNPKMIEIYILFWV